MARGWESKSVESQIDEREDRHRHQSPALTSEQLQTQTLRSSLELSRERILREFGETEHPRRREQLQAALDFLDQKLKAIAS